ncbi:MAG: histidine--tRNA ligase [Janthinobacterium lividum]
MALKYQRPKYTHDLFPEAPDWENDSGRRQALEDQFRTLCRVYGYGEVRTPMFENTELFKRSVGEQTDIVSKEMYTFETKGGDSLTLRPESTAPVLRAYIENSLHTRGGVVKLYYSAAHFRYERGQKGRYRQHEQLGVEALGTDDPALDAEVIQLALAFFHNVGIRNLTLKLNSVGSIESRSAYLVALKAFVEPFLSEFSAEGQGRFETNPLRLLDTKNPHELEILSKAPHLSAYLTEDERSHHAAVMGYLTDAGVAFVSDPFLVRGFDYYTKTAFEVTSPDIGAQDALGGGGRYNQLVETIGGPPTPGIGFGLGIERTLIALQSLNVEMPPLPTPTAYIITLGDMAKPIGIKLLSDLRQHGISAETEYGSRSMKAQMKAADRAKAHYAIILGDDEIALGMVQLKNLSGGWQHKVPIAEIVDWLAGDVNRLPAPQTSSLAPTG